MDIKKVVLREDLKVERMAVRKVELLENLLVVKRGNLLVGKKEAKMVALRVVSKVV